MMTSSFPIDLGLDHIEVIEVTTDENGHYHLQIRSTATEGICRICGNKINTLHEYDREIMIQHLPILGKASYLHIRLPRFKCQSCPKTPTTTLQPSWRNRKSAYTVDFEKYLLKSLINSTISDVSRKEGIGEGVISRLLDKYIEAEVNWDDIESLDQLGIDEIALKKGHKDFVTIVTSRIHGKIQLLGVLKDRKKSTIIEFFKSIPKRLKKTIKSVCSDFYEGFINAAKEVFGKRIRIVIDRFHLAKLYRKGLDTLRKKEMRRLKKHWKNQTMKNYAVLCGQ
jgi:transposase